MNDYSDKLIRLQQLVKELEAQLREKQFFEAGDTLANLKAEHDKLKNWLYHAGR